MVLLFETTTLAASLTYLTGIWGIYIEQIHPLDVFNRWVLPRSSSLCLTVALSLNMWQSVMRVFGVVRTQMLTGCLHCCSDEHVGRACTSAARIICGQNGIGRSTQQPVTPRSHSFQISIETTIYHQARSNLKQADDLCLHVDP